MNKYENGELTIYDKNDNEIILLDETILYYYERATPKKVVKRKAIIGGTHLLCECGDIQYYKGNFCPNCGQALDWD